MEQFFKILDHLNVSSIIIVENDLKPVHNEQEILSKYIMLSPRNKTLLINELVLNNHKYLTDKLKEFEAEFTQAEHNVNKDTYLVVGEIDVYLEKLVNPEKLKGLSGEIKKVIAENPMTKNILFKHGIASCPDTYRKFLELAYEKDKRDIDILLFEDIIPADFLKVEEYILSIFSEEQNSFIAIIDNMLGNGEPNGINIVTELTSFSKKNNLNIYPFILTSQSDRIPDPDAFENYNQLVVSKSSSDLIKEICTNISIYAHSQVFTFLQQKALESLTETAKIISKNKNNLSYILKKANKEGMLPYEAIRIWHENALNFYNDQLITNNDNKIFASTIGLSKIIHSENINEEDSLSDEFIEHLKHINANEIFDFSINSKHLPIAPGDIFRLGNKKKYLTLVGQTCDITVRANTLKRGAPVAELLNSKYQSKKEVEKFYTLKVKGIEAKLERHTEWIYNNINRKIGRGEHYLLFKDFKHNSDFGYLKIEYKTNSIVLYDFSVLDLCMYNNDGKCRINLNEPLAISLKNYLSDANVDNYVLLQEKFRLLSNIDPDNKMLLIDKTHGVLDSIINGDELSFDLQRICRIRGNFNQLIHHNYWHYRSRTDLNEINFTKD